MCKANCVVPMLIGAVWLFYRDGRNRKRMAHAVFVVVLVALSAYTLFTGATPSVVRAALMGAILLTGPVAGRRYDPASALALSAALMTLIDPDLLADGGFQLSFMATIGITYIAPHFYALLNLIRVPTFINLPVSASFGAQAAVTPLAALLTHEISFVSLPATLMAEISLLPLMITGILAG